MFVLVREILLMSVGDLLILHFLLLGNGLGRDNLREAFETRGLEPWAYEVSRTLWSFKQLETHMTEYMSLKR